MQLKQKFTVLLLSALMLFMMQDSSWAFYYNEGNDGDTESTAYVIDSLREFIRMRARVNEGTESAGKYYRLEADLEYDRNEILDYCSVGNTDHPFKGHFDGNGKTIHIVNKIDGSTVRINRPDVSLFGVIESSGTAVKNLSITGSISIAVEGADGSAAGLADLLKSGIIENCRFSGDVLAAGISYADAAGLVYTVSGDGIIRNCTFRGTVRAACVSNQDWQTSTAGGIAHYCSGVIENCTVLHGSIVSARNVYDSFITTYAGGIVGIFNYESPLSRISRCTSNASIEDAYYKGGIIGRISTYERNYIDEIPDDLNVKVFDNTFTGAKYAIGRPEGNPKEENPVHEFNGHTYKLFNESLTWQEAKEKCESMGGHLATITSTEENDFIFTILDSSITQNGGGVWLGGYGTKGASGTSWQWVTDEPMNFTAWMSGEPDYTQGDEFYIMYYASQYGHRGWVDNGNRHVVAYAASYICEWGDSIPVFLDIAAFERGRYSEVIDEGKYNGDTVSLMDEIGICIVSDNCYLNVYEEPVTEAMIYNIISPYEKIGLTADGNTRLIIRVMTNTPGYVSFSVPDDTGLTIETLDRQKLDGEHMVHNTMVNKGGIYQVSVVLIAPEAFPQSEARLAEFPMTKFNVDVLLSPDEGSELYRKTLPLELHATPVMLLHGRTSTVNDTFGTGREGYGIKRQLYNAGFEYYGCNYDGYQGPSTNLASADNVMRNKIAYIINRYNEIKIACTRVDIVAHSMGGLMAREFLNTRFNIGNKTIRSYGQISVRRIVTVATPHNGSPQANYLLWTGPDELLKSFKPVKPVRWLARRLFVDKREHGISYTVNPVIMDFEGDIIDLAVGSNFLYRLNMAEQEGLTEKVPMYAIYGRIRDEFRQRLNDAAAKAAKITDMIFTDEVSTAIIVAFDSLAIGIAGGMDVIFQNEDYDIAVGESSARYGMEGYCEGHTGARYAHTSLSIFGDSICMQDDIGLRVCKLLKGPVNVFKHGTSSSANASYAMPNYSLPRIKAADTEEEESSSITEHFKLNASANNLTVTDTASVIYSASFDKPLEYDMYIIIDMNKGSAIAKVADKGAKDFKFTLELSSKDTGIMDVSLFSHGSEDNTLFISNTQPLTVKPNLMSDKITGLTFGTDTVFTNVNMSRKFSIYAETENGNIHDAMLWSDDLTLKIDNKSVAVLDGKDRVRGISEDVTILTASYKNISASVSVNVGPALSINIGSGDIEPSPDIKAPSITTQSLPEGTEGKSYTAKISASGTAPITFSLTSGTLPEGLSFSDGRISGTPKKSGTFSLTFTASNSAGSSRKTFSLKINAASSGNPPDNDNNDVIAPRILTSAFPEGTIGKYYSEKIYSTGTPYITFTISSGNLPDGLKLSGNTIAGTPTKSGSFIFTVRAENPMGYSEQEFTLKINSTSENPNTPSNPEPDNGQDPEPDIVPDIILLRKRTIANLTQSEINSLSNDKSIIAAVLPQVRINKSGEYDFNDIEIYSAVPSGSVLVWNAFSSGDDNSYAQFFDKDGAELQRVPANRKINITAYLEAGKSYAPVITAIRQAQNNNSETDSQSSSGGGGGCNSCLAGIIIAVLCVTALRKN